MNFISPYGKAVSYEVPALKGIFLHPRSDDSPAGWTARKNPETGELELPGTPGGDGPYRFIGWGLDDIGGWTVRHTPGDFFFGNIDWIGTDKDAAQPKKGKYRLSYHGPLTRYFGTDAFAYGALSEHNNVYMEGKCIAVAPHPVLGAALQVGEEERTQEQIDSGMAPKTVVTLIVACFSGSQDVAYARVLPSLSGGVTRTAYTDEFRVREMGMYHEENNPAGWHQIGSSSLSTANQRIRTTLGDPRVPWFFNASGTAAVCVRECNTTLEVAGVEEEQRSYNKFRLHISVRGVSASYSDVGQQGSGFAVKIVTTVKRNADWVNYTRWPLYSSPYMIHTWAELEVRQVFTMSGFLVVASDFVGDEEVDLKYEVENYMKHSQFLYKGMDDRDVFNGSGNGLYKNTGTVQGDIHHVYDNPPTVATVQNPYGVSVTTQNMREASFLVFPGGERHPVSRRFSGTRTEFLTGVVDQDDYYGFFIFTLLQNPYVLDIRHRYMATYVDYHTYAGYSTPLLDRQVSEQLYTQKSPDYTVIAEDRYPQEVTPVIHRTFATADFWKVGDPILPSRYSWTTDDTQEYVVLDALWYVDLMQPPRWPDDRPNPQDFYQYSTRFKIDTGMHSVFDVLQSTANGNRSVGAGMDDHEHLAYSLEYRTLDGEIRYYNYLDNGDMGSLTSTSGTNIRFFNIGVG